MKAQKLARGPVLLLASLALLALAILVRTSSSGAAQSSSSAANGGLSLKPGQAAAERTRSEILPSVLWEALAQEYGHYKAVVSRQDFLNDLQTADIICIGEAHYDQRDMETAFEIARLLAQRRTIALAVERFSYVLQPRLDSLNELESPERRTAKLGDILQSLEYQTVWGTHSWDQTGFPVNTPSQASFEVMVAWAVRAGIPLIGLDVSLADRASGLGENIPYRNDLWKRQIDNFLARHSQENYLVVVIGGVRHMSNSPDSVPSKLNASRLSRVISVGQRDAMYQMTSSIRVQELARAFRMSDLIVQYPQFAVVAINTVAKFPDPPDYWIAVHTPDTWD